MKLKEYARDKKLKYNTATSEFWIFANELETAVITNKIEQKSTKKKDKLKEYLIKKGFVVKDKK